MMDDRKYVKFSYNLDAPYCDFNDLKLVPVKNDELISEIEFKEGVVTLYFKEDFILQENQSKEDLENYAENRLFAIFLEAVKNSSLQKFNMNIQESHIDKGKNIYVSLDVSIGMSMSCAGLEIRRADGSIITEEENKQMIFRANRDKMEQIILDSKTFLTIDDQNKERFFKLFNIQDPIIKYFILYSWLSELLPKDGRESQAEVNAFITNSKVYTTIPVAYQQPPLRNGKNDKTYFTYLRNLMGHTVTDTLSVRDTAIISEVKTCTHWLIQILLEKMF